VSGEKNMTSALEKEVVKRLLYSATPRQIPRSRFNRIGGFRAMPAMGLALVVSALITGASLTFNKALPMDRLISQQHWYGWLGPTLNLITLAGLAFAAQVALSSARLSQIAIGPATLTMDHSAGNYFDLVLDEIIYFFQRTCARVVIFEDLDRFDDAGIFLALRELNNLLNNSQQIEQPVSFVYAIRDSLFAEVPGADTAPSLPDAHARHGSDSAASDRAKFFDLVVPVVPFISHEVAADLLFWALSDLADELQPAKPLLLLAGRYFTDMRVILSIRNELEIFAAELLGSSAVPGLSAEQLLAMILYKHAHLDDFERIRTGQSRLDRAVDSLHQAKSELVRQIDVSLAEAEDSVAKQREVSRRAKEAGGRLIALLDVILAMRNNQEQAQKVTLTPNGTGFSRDEVSTAAFWRAIATVDNPSLTVPSNYGTVTLNARQLTGALGADAAAKTWMRQATQRDQQHLDGLRTARAWLLNATFSELLSGPYPTVNLGEDHTWDSLAEGCKDVLGEGLAFDLLRSGFIDQNFSLYTTKFHGAILSANARSYLMQYVDRHRSEPLFDLSSDDVDQILERQGPALLDDPSALNVAVVDHLVSLNPPLTPSALLSPGQAVDFLSVYLVHGQQSDRLLAHCAEARYDIFDVVADTPGLLDGDRVEALIACISGMTQDVDYALSTEAKQLLAGELDELAWLLPRLDEDAAEAFGGLIGFEGLEVSHLESVTEPLRSALARAGAFAITRRGLESLAPTPGKFGIDTFADLNEALSRQLLVGIDDYLAALEDGPPGYVVDDPDRLDSVVRLVLEQDPDDLPAALQHLPPGTRYETLTTAPPEAYEALATAGAFRLTVENFATYVAARQSLDPALTGFLVSQGAFDVAGEVSSGEEETARLEVAAEVIRSQNLDDNVKVALVRSLQTTETLDASALSLTSPHLAGQLLSQGEIADDADTFSDLLNCPVDVFVACATHSSKLATFVTDLALTDETLASLLTVKSIPEATQRALLSDYQEVAPAIENQAANAWIDAANRFGLPLTGPQIVDLAERGASSKRLLDLIFNGRSAFTTDELVSVLSHCDKPYSDLATVTGGTVLLPYIDAVRVVLQLLKSTGRVQDFKKRRLRDQYEVQL
jgi:hypothetical protein